MGKIVRYRHNVLDINSIGGFAGIRGSLHQGFKDVYFIRALGAGPDLISEIRMLDQKMTEEMKSGRQYYKRIGKLPGLPDQQALGSYTQFYEEWTKNPEAGMQTKEAAAGSPLARQLGTACSEVLKKYSQSKGSVTRSMEKNFAIKLLYWFDFVFAGIGSQWKENRSIKIAADNVEKEQEYLFYYFLTLTGCDVLLIQSRKDAAVSGSCRELSKEIRLGAFDAGQIPEYNAQAAGRTADLSSSVGSGVKASNYRESGLGTNQEKVVVKIPQRSRRKTQKQPAGQTPAGSAPPQGPQMPAYGAPPQMTRTPAGSAPPQERKEKSFEELARLASSIVLIAVHNQNGDIISTGSGIMIGEAGYILTNNHVAGGGCFYSIRIEDDAEVYRTDELIKYHPVLDLAVMRIQRKLTPLPIYKGGKKLARGQAVAAIGSPLGLFNSVSNGIISGFRKVDGVDMIQFTAPISHGSSGGAVLNLYGEVIGISTAGFDEGQNINLAVGYESIRPFIRGFV